EIGAMVSIVFPRTFQGSIIHDADLSATVFIKGMAYIEQNMRFI
ncbi:hypothetical protein LCGC14_2182630, partial [marine sediment metagenome]